MPIPRSRDMEPEQPNLRPLTTDDARSSLALAIYAIASSRMMHRTCSRVELHHLPTGSVVEWEHTEESLGRHLRRAEEVAAEAAAADAAYRAAKAPGDVEHLFPPSTGPICSWCDYRRHCPEGQAAAPDRAPWEGLAP